MRLRRIARSFFFCALLSLSSACGSSSNSSTNDGGVDEGPPRPRFAVPATLDALNDDAFFDHPWPSDLRREADGSVRLDGYVNVRAAPLITKYIGVMRGKVDGFSPAGAGYLGFTASVDPRTIPADGVTANDATVQLVDVDPTSPEIGSRHPMRFYYRDPVGDYYTKAHTLAWMPLIGNPLRRHTTYAIVATRGLETPSGRAFAPNDVLQSVLDQTATGPAGQLAAKWKPFIDSLEKQGVSRSQIAHLSIFTTSDPVGELLEVADDARAQPTPHVTDVAYRDSAAGYDRYFGHYDGSPDYQTGDVPFKTDGGSFSFDAAGKPQLQRTFALRYLLDVPKAAKCPMPTKGYPLVLYAHGTGGDYQSFDRDGTGAALADQCVASMGIDQIFHGERPGAPPASDPSRDSKIAFLFFNVDNIMAARTNGRQAAIDEVARVALAASGGLNVPASVSKSGADIAFDPARLGFFGHSQGGLNGPLFLAVDDRAKGGVMSGSGSEICYSLLAKTKPEPSVAGLVVAILAVQSGNEAEINELHPILSFVQMLVDPVDPVHYYPALARKPFEGHVAKSILMTEGVNPDGTGDSYAPPRTIEAGAIAARFPILQPVVRDIPELTGVAGVAPIAAPVSGNAADGKATVALAQFSPPATSDGHFVVFDVPAARTMAAKFCASLLTDPVPFIGK